MLSIGQAAKLAGVSKAKLSQAIESSKVSATKNNDGGWDGDPAEICRVYPPANAATDGANGGVQRTLTVGGVQRTLTVGGVQRTLTVCGGQRTPTVVAAPDETAVALARAEANIDGLLAQLEQMHEALTDAREQRDQWKGQAEANQKLIADMRPASARWWPWQRAE